jgi:excisionase family DNA binding protein
VNAPCSAPPRSRSADEARTASFEANTTVISPSVSVVLTSEQAAECLQVSLRTIKNLMSDGQLAYIKVGRATRIHRHDIEEYLARNRRRQRKGLRAS